MAVSTQLDAMAQAGKEIEDTVGEVIGKGCLTNEERNESIQGLDRMVQLLGELSLFVRDISPQVSDDVEIDLEIAIGRIKLRELATALGCRANPRPTAAQLHPAGEFDLF